MSPIAYTSPELEAVLTSSVRGSTGIHHDSFVSCACTDGFRRFVRWNYNEQIVAHLGALLETDAAGCAG